VGIDDHFTRKALFWNRGSGRKRSGIRSDLGRRWAQNLGVGLRYRTGLQPAQTGARKGTWQSV